MTASSPGCTPCAIPRSCRIWSRRPPCAAEPGPRGECPQSLGLNHAELFHLREDVDNPPDLGDPAVDEPHNEDLGVGDGFAGWRKPLNSPRWVPVTVSFSTTLSPSSIRSSIVM